MEPAHRSRLVPVVVTVVVASVAFAFVFTGNGAPPSTTVAPPPLAVDTTHPDSTTATTTMGSLPAPVTTTTAVRPAPEPPPAGWERIDGGPLTARFGTAAAWMDGSLVLWGGAPLNVGSSTDGAVFRRGRTGGPWETTPPPPLVTGDRALMVRADDRIFVTGGQGAAFYDPSDGVWELLDRPDPSLTRPLAAVWTGNEVIVVGHMSTAPGSARLAGVAYTTDGACCRHIAAPPVDLTTAWAFWTGHRMLLVGARFDIGTNRPLDERPGFASYDPANDRWDLLDGPDLDGIQALAAAWNGEELLLWDYTTAAAAWHPDRGWRRLSNVAVPFSECYPDSAVATDGRVFALHCADAAYFEPGADRWVRIATPPTPRDAPRSCALVGTDDDVAEVFLWCTPTDGGDPVLFAVDLDTVETLAVGEPARPSEWELVPNPLWARRDSASLVWTGQELAVWGGFDGVTEVFAGWAYDPATGVMHRIPDAPAPGRPGQSAVWTGAELVVWRGSVTAWDPIALEWRVIEAATPSVQLHPGNTAIWTGTQVLFWGASRFVGGSEGGAALDPATGAWAALPPSPVGPRTDALVVWSGEELYVWGGLAFGAQSWEQMGAAYDPATDEWRSLPPLPDGLRIAGPVGGWVDGELIVFGQRAGRLEDDEPDVAGVAYDPGSDSWRAIADLPGPTWPGEGLAGSMSAATVGDRLAVWLPAEYFGDEPGMGFYDPTFDTWVRWSGAPADAYGPPLVAAGDRVAALTGDGLLILTPAR